MRDATTLLALCFGILLGVVHFFSEKIQLTEGHLRYRVVSFAAGVSIAYLFLVLLPETYQAATHLKEWVFVFLLLGFAAFHLVEKLTYQHADRDMLMRELKETHSVLFFCYYFVIGVVLEDLLKVGVLEGSLFLIPVALHAGLSTASLSEIHGEIRESLLARIVLSVSTLLGVAFALLVSMPLVVSNILIGLIAGALLYIIVKEFLPEREKGQPLFFLLGLVLFSGLKILIVLVKG